MNNCVRHAMRKKMKKEMKNVSMVCVLHVVLFKLLEWIALVIVRAFIQKNGKICK